MPATLRWDAVVSLGGASAWRIKHDMLIEVDGTNFVKISPVDYSFIKLVSEDIVDRLPTNPTLSQCPGMRKLQQLRNQQHLAKEASPMAKLFAGVGAERAQKRTRLTAAAVKELRDAPNIITLNVPAFSDHGPMAIECLSPVFGLDDIIVKLDEHMIEHIVLWIRHHGVTYEMLGDKRKYNSSDTKGVWAHGDGNGFVVKLPAMFTRGGGKPQKYVRVQTAAEAVDILSVPEPVPVMDGTSH